jgi:hypothetical protein
MKTEATLRKLASGLPGAELGIACEGTKLESTTFGVKKKVFLFLRKVEGKLELRFKLQRSTSEAKALQRLKPKVCRVGAGGWTKLNFGDSDAPEWTTLKRWINESHSIVTDEITQPGDTLRPARASRPGG